MPAVRARVLGAALLFAVAATPACGSSEPARTVVPPPSAPKTTSSVQADAGAVQFEVGGPPGAQLTIDWGIGSTTAHTEHPAPWSHNEIAPMTPFSVTLQANLTPPSDGQVSCRITVEGREVVNKTQPGGALCTAMNLNRSPRPWTPTS